MSDSHWREEISKAVPTLQIVLGAIIAGCLVFLGIALAVGALGGNSAGGERSVVLTYISALCGLAALVVRLILPDIIKTQNRQKIVRGTWRMPYGQDGKQHLVQLVRRTGDAGKLWVGYFTSTLIGAAIVEGAAFFCIVAYLIERSNVGLIVIGILLISAAALIPTRSSALSWIENQLELIRQQQHFSR